VGWTKKWGMGGKKKNRRKKLTKKVIFGKRCKREIGGDKKKKGKGQKGKRKGVLAKGQTQEKGKKREGIWGEKREPTIEKGRGMWKKVLEHGKQFGGKTKKKKGRRKKRVDQNWCLGGGEKSERTEKKSGRTRVHGKKSGRGKTEREKRLNYWGLGENDNRREKNH